MASDFGTLIQDMDDGELASVRASVPAHWWDLLHAATSAPDDPTFIAVLSPIGVEIATWDDDQRQLLQDDLLDAVGWSTALKVRKILVDAGIL